MESASTGVAHSRVAQCLAFSLGGQPYAVDILAVQEIRRYSTPTRMPTGPSHLAGVINLRGAVVPVFDLRLRFGLPEASFDRLTVIIVVALGARNVGLIVDDVSKVLHVQDGAIQPPPSLAEHIDSSFIAGLLRENDQLVTLLNIERLLSDDVGGMA